MSELDRNTYYGKISQTAKEFNKIDLQQMFEKLEVEQIGYGFDNTKGSIKQSLKEPIEYIVETEELTR